LASAAQVVALFAIVRRMDWGREAERAGASVWRARGSGVEEALVGAE
jgi:hypothetical protein